MIARAAAKMLESTQENLEEPVIFYRFALLVCRHFVWSASLQSLDLFHLDIPPFVKGVELKGHGLCPRRTT